MERLKRILISPLDRIKKYLDRASPVVTYLRTLKNQNFGQNLTKKAFLVLGPESHGSHLVTDILINAGCIGHAGNHVPWQPENKVLLKDMAKPWEYEFPTDLQPWDNRPPVDETPIVWRRSLPHGKKWSNLTQMIRDLTLRGYQVRAVVVSRDTFSGIQSQLKWRHVKDEVTGLKNISKAYLHIFKHLQKTNIPFVLVNYESLAKYPKAQDFLLTQLGLPLPQRRWPIYDGNMKWHDHFVHEDPAYFPEGWYPSSVNATEYFERVQQGYKTIAEQEVVICGLARDVMQALPKLMAKIECLGKKFKDYTVIIVENDSVDGTAEMLQYWQRINSNVTIISQNKNARKWGQVIDVERTTDMAGYRNLYLQHIREHNLKLDYMIVLDMDIPLGFSYDGIAHTFGDTHWDVMASNGILVPPFGNPISNPMFYDAFAFRSKDESKVLSMEEINQLKFSRGEALVPVNSAFGGLAIYHQSVVSSDVVYSGEDCEHVVFHERLRHQGLDRQFLNPSQLVLYSGS